MNNPYVKTLEPVWGNTDHVRVNEEKLQKLIEGMKQKKEKGELIIPGWNVPNVQPPMDCEPAEWIDYICWINTVNFAFTNFQPPWNKFSVENKDPTGKPWDGAFAMGASFMRAHKEGIRVFDAEYMARISLEDVRHIFRSVDPGHSIPMIRERWKIFHEIGKALLRKYNGTWIKLFLDGNWRAFDRGKGIVERLVADFPSFRDERFYKGHRLVFNKRAQLLVMIYHGRAVNSGARMPEIKDIGDIGPICDYELPKVLEFPDVRVLEYSLLMKAKIENHHIFMPGEPMETENRLSTAYVLKRICDEVGINMAQADYYVWNRGRKSSAPHILVPTTDY